MTLIDEGRRRNLSNVTSAAVSAVVSRLHRTGRRVQRSIAQWRVTQLDCWPISLSFAGQMCAFARRTPPPPSLPPRHRADDVFSVVTPEYIPRPRMRCIYVFTKPSPPSSPAVRSTFYLVGAITVAISFPGRLSEPAKSGCNWLRAHA